MLRTSPTRSRRMLPWVRTPVPPMVRSDDELLVDVGTGDHEALAVLRRHLGGLVHANIWRALHDTARVDAVSDAVFEQVGRRAAQYDPSRTSAVIWILGLAYELVAEHNRTPQLQG